MKVGDTVLLVMLSLISVSCSMELIDDRNVGNIPMVEMSFSSGTDTKASFSDDYLSIFWRPGDRISIFSSDRNGLVGNSEFKENGLTEGQANASFDGLAYDDSPLYAALYPYSSGASCNVSGKISASVPVAQIACPGTFDPDASLAVGYTAQAGGNLHMMNVCGWVGISVPEAMTNIRSVTLLADGSSVPLAGGFTLSPDKTYTSFTISADSETFSSSVQLVGKDGGTIAPGKYYLSVLPSVLDGFSIKVEFSDGRVGTLSTDKSLTVSRNKRIFLITLNPSLLSYATVVEELSVNQLSFPVYGWSGTEFNALKPFNILYGSGCCDKYGEHLKMFDGNVGTNWLTYITKTADGARYGDPFVVIDLGTEFLISDFGVAIQSNADYECRPCEIEFYVTDDVPSISMSADELSLMCAGDNLESNETYASLDSKLRAYDSSLNWVKAAGFNAFDADFIQDFYKAGDRYVPMDQSIVSSHKTYRYVKMVLHKPQEGSNLERPRNAIGEFYLRKYSWYDGYEFPSSAVSPNPGSGTLGGEVPGSNISGSYYDWTVTKQPERPYMLSYHDKMLMKFLLASKDGNGGTYVRMTFEDVLENIKKIDELTRGIEKIVYLIGWQYEGHDSKYPAMAEFNSALKRPQDATSRESWLWLQSEARKYNTYVSAHININDAYEDSPLYMYYLNNDILVRWADGSLWSSSQNSHKVLLTKEWSVGWLQKRIDDVIELLNLKDSPTVHLDVFLPLASPYHGITEEQELQTLRKVARYWRDRGVDITVETWHNLGQRVDPMFGLIPAVWWNDMTKDELATLHPSFATGSRIFPGWDYYDTYPGPQEIQDLVFLFGENVHGEDIVSTSTDFEEFKYRFCISTLPYVYYNTHEVVSFDQNAGIVTYSGGIVADASSRLVTENGRVIRQGNDIFMPAAWKSIREIIAYSKDGYSNREWILPSDWNDVSMAKIIRVGTSSMAELVQIKDGKITLTLSPNEMVAIQPIM